MTAIVYETKEEKLQARKKMIEAKTELLLKMRQKMSQIKW